MPCVFSSDQVKSTSVKEAIAGFLSVCSGSLPSSSLCITIALSDTANTGDQSGFDFRRILSGYSSFCQTTLSLNSAFSPSPETVLFVFPYDIFEKRRLRNTGCLSSNRSIDGVCKNDHSSDQSSMEQHRTVSRSSDHLNERHQQVQDSEEEFQFGTQATPCFGHSTTEPSRDQHSTEVRDAEDQPCNKKQQQARDTDTCLSKPYTVPFVHNEPCRSIQSTERITDSPPTIVPSATVTPLPPSTVLIDSDDGGKTPICSSMNSAHWQYTLGEWSSVVYIGDSKSMILSRLASLIGSMECYSSLETFFNNHPENRDRYYFIVHSDPISTEILLPLVSQTIVKKNYIHCSEDRLEEFDNFSTCYPGRFTVFQQQDTLILLLLWDLADFLKNLGIQYDAMNQTEKAQTRYRSAHRVRIIIQTELADHQQRTAGNR